MDQVWRVPANLPSVQHAGDTPEMWTLAGAAVIVVSGMFIVIRESRQTA
jgi:hypothetical protein